ncbi:MAG: extracellular solute-binding protein [Clostridia bacterium]|nr:extracellular solute-binding protein [Clostridia bacterium]
MKTRWTRIVAILLAVGMLVGMGGVSASAATDSKEDSYSEILASLTAESYGNYLAGCKKDGAVKGKVEIPIDIFNFAEKDTVSGKNAYTYDLPNGEQGLFLPEVGEVTWTVDISAEDAGLYGIRIEYYTLPGKNSSIERKLYLDGIVPFDEARSLSFSKVWKYEYSAKDENGENTFETDVNGNDLRAEITQVAESRTYECTDTDGFYNEAFQFFFKEGKRSISLVGSKETLIVTSITLYPVEELKTLKDYKSEWANAGYTNASADAEITYIRAETPDKVSDTAVYPANDRSSCLTAPIDSFSQKINTIGASSYSTNGQWASYTFTVSESGIYNIVARFKQTVLQGMFTSRVVKLASSDGYYGYADGTPSVPYEECYYTRFNYQNSWQVAALNDGTDTLSFYFEEGVTYTLCMEVGLGNMASILETIENSLTVINNCYLEILKLTGSDPDEYRDYNFSSVMPSTIRQLLIQATVLRQQADNMETICGTSGSNIATLETIYRLLERMGSYEDEIAPNLENLKSYIGTLGTWINTAKTQSLTVDYYQIQSPDAKLPKSNANIFQSFWYEFTSFIASFFVDYNAMGVTDADADIPTIEVWIAYGRDQSQIWRNMINNDFTPNHDIAVNLKLVTATTLLPSVLAKKGPDAYIGLDAASTINYAIRNAIMSIESLDGYSEVLGYETYQTDVPVYDEEGNIVARRTVYFDEEGNEVDPSTISFNAATMIPISLFGKTYGLPEKASVQMMFYRRDVLAELQIDVPKTWDDVLSTIPTLQANNMQIGLTYSFAINVFLYQFGGNLWKYTDDPEYAGAQIGLDTDIALDSFQFCTRLYTDYSFPVTFDGPNRLRTGEIPLLIADYATTYNTLVVFATEIRGLWAFTNIPGMIRDDGTVNNDSFVTVTATVMLNGCENVDATWEYMKWQAGGSRQAQYGNEMVALVGPAAKYDTANIQALHELSWSASELDSLLEQFDHLSAIPNYPGSYIITRYTQFAFLDAKNEGMAPVDALQSYISAINQEITRKREEFGLKTLPAGLTPDQVRKEEANE